MANITRTVNDTFSVELAEAEFRDEIVTFSGADTYAKGTILARRADALSVTASAVSGGGNGTVSAATVVEGPVVPIVGVYTLTCTLAVTNGGKWKLTDPNAAIVADDLEQTVGAGGATVFEVGGLQFTITDGSTDFSAGATATLTVAADGKLVPFVVNGPAGTQFPRAVLTYDLTKAGAGDLPAQVLVAGKVNKKRLIIKADGDDTNVSNAVIDQLRAVGITPIDVKQLAQLDN